MLEDTRVLEIDRSRQAIRIVSERSVLHADRVVIASGAWLRELVPVVRPYVTVVPQTVEYFRLGVPARSLPAWVHFGGAESGVTYGLAELGRDAPKAAHHVTQGPDTNPDEVAPPAHGETDAVRAVLERFLAVPVLESLGIERCLYTMTPTEDFVIDHWPGDPRVAFASACSGHGFKFAPLTGRILAELLVNGRADLPGGPTRPRSSLFAAPRCRAPTHHAEPGPHAGASAAMRFGVYLPMFAWRDLGVDQAARVKEVRPQGRRPRVRCALGRRALPGGARPLRDRVDVAAALPGLMPPASPSRIRLATGLLILPYYHPVTLAREIQTLWHLSGGRFVLGVGPGWDRHEFETLGMQLSERGRRTDEMIAALRRLLTERDVSFAGRHYRFEHVTIEPLLPRFPELWVGGGSKIQTSLSPDKP